MQQSKQGQNKPTTPQEFIEKLNVVIDENIKLNTAASQELVNVKKDGEKTAQAALIATANAKDPKQTMPLWKKITIGVAAVGFLAVGSYIIYNNYDEIENFLKSSINQLGKTFSPFIKKSLENYAQECHTELPQKLAQVDLTSKSIFNKPMAWEPPPVWGPPPMRNVF